MYKKYASGLPDKLVNDVYDFLLFRKKTVYTAPFESDSQLASLYALGKIDYVLSEDSDMIAYNCLKLVKSLRIDGKCKILNLVDSESKSAEIQSIMKLGKINRLHFQTAFACHGRM